MSLDLNQLETRLWAAADQLWANTGLKPSEFSNPVLGLIFLRYAEKRFHEAEARMIKSGLDAAEIEKIDYQAEGALFLPDNARFSYLLDLAEGQDLGKAVNEAMAAVEAENEELKGVLPRSYGRLPNTVLVELLRVLNGLGEVEGDAFGKIYEYFLGKFALAEGQKGGVFYTPTSIVKLIVEIIEPFHGKIFDPACGSGGMFVQSAKFKDAHQKTLGKKGDLAIYGQELTATTYKLAKMNLAIRGIAANLGEVPADTFFKDQHPDLKADFIMANPPFNLKAWRADNELSDDPRWAGYEVPPTGNANYGWILHMVSKLSENGVAGFVLANGSMSTNTKGEGEIRKKLIENDLVDCMIALPGQLFYTTQIPVCLWFLSKNKKAQTVAGHSDSNHRDRQGETLFIDARNLGTMVDRTHKELTSADIADIARTYHAWRGEAKDGEY